MPVECETAAAPAARRARTPRRARRATARARCARSGARCSARSSPRRRARVCSGIGTDHPDPCDDVPRRGRVDGHAHDRRRGAAPASTTASACGSRAAARPRRAAGSPATCTSRCASRRDPTFERQRRRLWSTACRSSIVQAALGTELDARDARRRPRPSRSTPGTQPGASIRLRGLGVPSLRSGRRGDLVVEIDVEVPTQPHDRGGRAARAVRGAARRDGRPAARRAVLAHPLRVPVVTGPPRQRVACRGRGCRRRTCSSRRSTTSSPSTGADGHHSAGAPAARRASTSPRPTAPGAWRRYEVDERRLRTPRARRRAGRGRPSPSRARRRARRRAHQGRPRRRRRPAAPSSAWRAIEPVRTARVASCAGTTPGPSAAVARLRDDRPRGRDAVPAGPAPGRSRRSPTSPTSRAGPDS